MQMNQLGGSLEPLEISLIERTATGLAPGFVLLAAVSLLATIWPILMAHVHVCGRYNRTATVDNGGISRMFERVLADFPQYSPRMLSHDPWVILFDSFLSDEEADHLIGQCEPNRWRLAGTGANQALQSSVRNASMCWCDWAACRQHELTTRIETRIAELTLTPINNSEKIQVVRYWPGQYYRSHHDQGSSPRTPQGARLYTFFMYLSSVEEGGGTHFNDLGITVNASKGSAVLWPSLMDVDVSLPELRTHHESLPVVRGLKYAANAWIHMHDYRRLEDAGCEVVYDFTYVPDARLADYRAARRKAGLDADVPLSLQLQPPDWTETLMRYFGESWYLTYW